MPPLPSDPIPAFRNCKGRSHVPLAILSAIAGGHTRGPLPQLGLKTEKTGDCTFATSIEMSWRMGIARGEGVVELIRASYCLGSILGRMSLPL